MAKFSHFGKIFKVLDNLRGFIYYLGIYWTNFGKFCMSLGKWYKWPNVEKTLAIWSHCWNGHILVSASTNVKKLSQNLRFLLFSGLAN